MTRRAIATIILLVIFVIAGCSSGPYQTAPDIQRQIEAAGWTPNQDSVYKIKGDVKKSNTVTVGPLSTGIEGYTITLLFTQRYYGVGDIHNTSQAVDPKLVREAAQMSNPTRADITNFLKDHLD